MNGDGALLCSGQGISWNVVLHLSTPDCLDDGADVIVSMSIDQTESI
jgi:hypothetical protein